MQVLGFDLEVLKKGLLQMWWGLKPKDYKTIWTSKDRTGKDHLYTSGLWPATKLMT